MKKIAVLKNISKIYTTGKISLKVLDNVSFEVLKGEFLCIMGPSGSGKSTLMHILGCLDVSSSGTYLLDGQNVTHLNDSQLANIRNKKIGFVFQAFNLIPRLNAIENVELPLDYAKVKNPRNLSMSALEKVGLQDRMKHRTNELSGGECQRVAIARAIVNNPLYILADEPTGNLDSKTGKSIMNLFLELHKEGRTIVMVTHDRNLANYAQRILFLKDGQIEKIESLK